MELKSRIKLLEKAKSDGKKVALYIVEDTISAQFRYRCNNILEATEKSKKWQAVWFLNAESSEVLKRINLIDLVVIVRQAAKNNTILNLVSEFKKKDIKVIFDLDDLIFDYYGLVSLMEAIGSVNFVGWLGYIWGVRRIAKRVDGFIATNEYLGNRLEKRFEKPVGIIPNSLNKKQMKVSKEYLKKKNHDGFIIGYFSGSPTHIKDFKVAEPGLIKFLEKYADVKLMVVGYMDFSEEMKRWKEKGRVEILGLVDYEKLQELIAGVDVNIAPLIINDFTNCKSELKYFEAAIVETTTIASPSFSFKNVINDGENGLLAQSGEWYAKLEYLHNNLKINKAIAKKAKEEAEKEYFGSNFLKKVEGVFDFFGNNASG